MEKERKKMLWTDCFCLFVLSTNYHTSEKNWNFCCHPKIHTYKSNEFYFESR